jgi:hypothetical protein
MAKPTYQIIPLTGNSGSFNPINITSISSASPNTLHTASTTDFDELWLECYNYSNSDVILTLGIGGMAAHQRLTQVVPFGRGLVPLIRGTKLSGGTTIQAYSSVANAVSILGYAHRIVFI